MDTPHNFGIMFGPYPDGKGNIKADIKCQNCGRHEELKGEHALETTEQIREVQRFTWEGVDLLNKDLAPCEVS